jgi:hypothetical protein
MFVQEGSDASSDTALLRAARDARVEIETVSKHDLNVLTGSPPRPHNGVVLDASALTPTPIDQLPRWDPGVSAAGSSAPAPVWLALDEVVDPQNLGAFCYRAGPRTTASARRAPNLVDVSRRAFIPLRQAGPSVSIPTHAPRRLATPPLTRP